MMCPGSIRSVSLRWPGRLGLAAGLTALVAIVPTACFGADAPPVPLPERLDHFRTLSPAERLRLVERVPQAERYFQKVARGNVVATLVERGTLEPTVTADIICPLKAPSFSGMPAGTIKWVIDEGTFVKRGDRVVEFDRSFVEERIATQKVMSAQAAAAKLQAEEEWKARKGKDVDLRLAEITLKIAELELKRYTGTDSDVTEILKLKVEEGSLLVERARTVARAREAQAEAEVESRRQIAQQEAARLRDLEDYLTHCTMVAPQDGLVLYASSDRDSLLSRRGVIAQGEAVREGQKLLRICDLKQMLVHVKVHEALVARLRPSQKAQVRIDAFPDKELAAEVKSVATVASSADWLSADVKLYATVLALTEQQPGLRPGMTGEVRIVLDERSGVLHVPVQAVLGTGRDRYCFVRTAAGIEERKVVTGLWSDAAVEVRDGLKEGDVVLRDPRALLGRPEPWRGKDAGGQGARSGGQILVRSVRLTLDDAARRTFVETYGLTYADLRQMKRLTDVAQLVPLRIFPQEIRVLERMDQGRVIATTEAFRECAGLKQAAGRFLTDDDEAQTKNVAVLGSAAAAALFPREDSVGHSVRVGGQAYLVVGVLEEQARPVAGLKAEEANHGVYIPLRTCAARFGERVFIRQGAARRAEAVQLSAILVLVSHPAAVPAAADGIRELLRAAHKRPDWEVQAAERP